MPMRSTGVAELEELDDDDGRDTRFNEPQVNVATTPVVGKPCERW